MTPDACCSQDAGNIWKLNSHLIFLVTWLEISAVYTMYLIFYTLGEYSTHCFQKSH